MGGVTSMLTAKTLLKMEPIDDETLRDLACHFIAVASSPSSCRVLSCD